MRDHGRNRRSSGSYVLWAACPKARCAGSSTSALVSVRSCRPKRQRRGSKRCMRLVAKPGGSGRSQRPGGLSLSEQLPEGSRFAVLASGSGTNLQALLDAYPENLVVVAGNKKEAFAFERARRAGVPVEHVDPAGSTCSTGTPARRARSKAKASFLFPATTTRFSGYASSKACRFVPEPEVNTAKREPSGSRSDKRYAPGFCDLTDPPGIATCLTQRLETRFCLFGRHDRAETNAQVEDPAHLAFGQAAKRTYEPEDRR